MNTIHVISENDLQHWKKIGRRIRSLCPIHHSRDRDLSINPYSEYLDEDDQRIAGFGYCHSANCGATVLVQEWNPTAAARILGRPVTVREPKVSITAKDLEKAEAWQRRELASLNKIYPHATSQLRHERASAYLAQRGLGGQEALDLLESLGIAYVPPAEEWKSPSPDELRKWCDRIIFPFTCSNGERGYLGRSLRLWQPGMDENEHKQILVEHDKRMEEEHGKDAPKYEIRRWRKTYRSGFFNAQIMTEHRHLYICEGPFDVIPLLLAGFPDVVAVAGTHIDSKAIPKNVFDVTLAFDGDMHGQNAMEKTADLLSDAGITPIFCIPPDDGNGKDWSERYKYLGADGLDELLESRLGSQERFPEEDLGPLEDGSPEDDLLVLTNEQRQNVCSLLRQMVEGTCPADSGLPDAGPLGYLMSVIFEAYQIGAESGRMGGGPDAVRRAIEALSRDEHPWLAEFLVEASSAPAMTFIAEGSRVITSLGRGVVSRIYHCQILKRQRVAVIMDLWQSNGAKLRVFDLDELRLLA